MALPTMEALSQFINQTWTSNADSGFVVPPAAPGPTQVEIIQAQCDAMAAGILFAITSGTVVVEGTAGGVTSGPSTAVVTGTGTIE